MVPKQDIVDNDYDLSINKYKEIEYVPVEYPSTLEIMTNIREIEMEIGKEMDELEKLLELQEKKYECRETVNRKKQSTPGAKDSK